jgi:hypothetical protein
MKTRSIQTRQTEHIIWEEAKCKYYETCNHKMSKSLLSIIGYWVIKKRYKI